MAEFAKIKVSKPQAATVQLEAAIKIFFEGVEVISAYTLASAANGILEGIYLSNRDAILARELERLDDATPLRFSWKEEWEIRIKEEHHKDFFRMLNKPQNFFKHADRDANEDLEFGGAELTASQIFMTCTNYRLVLNKTTAAIGVFVRWYLMLYPRFMTDDHPIKEVMKLNAVGDDILEKYGYPFLMEIGYKNLVSSCPELFQRKD